MLIPAINGTKNILEATKLEPRIKRVVFTSSFAAVCDVLDLPSLGRTYTPESWNPATYDEAKVSTHPGMLPSTTAVPLLTFLLTDPIPC